MAERGSRSISNQNRVDEVRGRGDDARALSRLDSLKAGFRAGTPFAVAAALVSISFGVLAEPVMGSGAALAMSAFVFAGSAQFGATAVLASGGGPLPAIVAAVLLNARYVPMGIALAPSLRGGPLRRAAYGEAMIDASWAMASRGGGRFDPDFLVGATLPSYPAWVGGTAIGVFAGDAIADPEALGLDALFPAFFLALLAGELRAGRARRRRGPRRRTGPGPGPRGAPGSAGDRGERGRAARPGLAGGRRAAGGARPPGRGGGGTLR